MKTTLLLITLLAPALFASEVQAETKTLTCSPGGHTHVAFKATLDFSSFDKGSGLFRIKNASIVDNYASARLICAGHTLKEIDCVGFWFDRGDLIARVAVRSKDGETVAAYRTMTGEHKIKGGPLPCSVE